MKYSFAIAALFAICSVDAISISAAPAEKTAEEKDKILKAKLAVQGEKKEAQDELALKAETKSMNDAETEKERNARYMKEVYNKNRDDQAEEAKFIKNLRKRPADSKPMSAVLGTEPIARTACDEVTDRPSSQRTTTCSPSESRFPSASTRSIACARAPISNFTPRSMNSCSSTAATSGSLPGSTCCRLTTSVTSEPNDENMWTNSTPVTPDPTTVTLSGKTRGG